MRQVFSVMAFMRPTSTHSAAGAEHQSQNLPSPDLVRQTALVVTFSYAKTTLHYSQVWPETNVKDAKETGVFLRLHNAKCSKF